MIRDDIIYLVAENPEAHGVFDPPTETRKMVYCQVLSVGRNEYYAALSHGLNPSIIFRLGTRLDYAGEKVLIWNDQRYRVIRTYSDGDSIELTAEEITADRGAQNASSH